MTDEPVDIAAAALTALDAGDVDQARRLAGQALADRPDAEPLWRLAGLCARLVGDAGDAERCWRRCIELAPSAAMCLRLGDLLIEQARATDARLCWRGAAWLDGQVVEAVQHRLDATLPSLVDDDAAIEALYTTAADETTGPRTAIAFGVRLAASGRLHEAERAHRLALALLPGDAAALTDLGLVLEALGRLAEAEALQRRAHAVAPESIEIVGHLADVLAAGGDDVEAERLYRMAIAREPDAATLHSNLGVLLFDAGRFDEAEASFQQALKLRPGALSPALNLGQLWLATGRLAAGWALCDRRYAADPQAALPGFPADTGGCRRWDGAPLAGRSLIVWAEQGYGDQLQFVRYLAAVRGLGLRRLTLVCAPALQRLFERLDAPDEVVPLSPDAARRLAEHDVWAPLLGLPLHCGAGVLAMSAPYIGIAPEWVAQWSALLPSADGGRRVGLVWRGNPLHDNDRDRSLPGLAALAPLWSVPGVRFISLQKGADEPSGRSPAEDQPLTHVGSAVGDFADTAAIVAQLDLVICVDTAVAHLAGALGVPCWALLPARRCDWRWQQGRSDSDWYPSLRLFRQASRGDWTVPIAAVVAALRSGHLPP